MRPIILSAAILSPHTEFNFKTEGNMKKQLTSYSIQQDTSWSLTHIKTEVQFGSPKHRCKGVGICKVMLLSPTQQAKKPIAYISVLRNEKVKFEFLKDSLSEEMLKMHFKDMLFVVVDEFQFSDTLLKRMNAKNWSITPGMYEVKNTKRFLSITF